MNKTTNDLFREFLKDQNITVRELAKLTGISESTLYNYTGDPGKPHFRSMPAVSLAYVKLLSETKALERTS